MADTPKRTFKTSLTADATSVGPETLFTELRGRSSEIKHLWSHQADILRAYEKIPKAAKDVALELPTGAGKTLVGCLIAEHRRRAYGERVAYLCPTRQLAHQVANSASKYGIDNVLLLPKEYEGLRDYRQSKAIGITTYSAVFNTNPRINDAQVLLMDDAHAAESYISDLWSMHIGKYDHPELYTQALDLLESDIHTTTFRSLLGESFLEARPNDIEHVPQLVFLEKIQQFEKLFDDLLDKTASPYYPWQKLKGNLHACAMYASAFEILIRPLSPPTLTHAAFADAGQRIYMSATLGNGGELERITGIREIVRIPLPTDQINQGSGRRLFLFPEMNLDQKDSITLIQRAIKQTHRVLVLTPTERYAAKVRDDLQSRGINVMASLDVEEDLSRFINSENAALVLANRYDGIDLPDDACRLTILCGIPVGANLQEQFLYSKVRANALLKDRLRTRLTQGVGRCCRNSADYAAVIVLDQGLTDFCARQDVRSGMSVELQAEIEFGLDNSEDLTIDAVLDLLGEFYKQDEAWKAAESAIQGLKSRKKREEDKVASILRSAVKSEIDFVYELWRSNPADAVQIGMEVAERLAGPEVSTYRSWWYYWTGVAANLAAVKTPAMRAKAAEMFANALKASQHTSWFAASLSAGPSDTTEPVISPLDAEIYQSSYENLTSLGFLGSRFNRFSAAMTGMLGEIDFVKFETGLKHLGNAIGFRAVRPDETKGTTGAPDGVWLLSDKVGVAFEAKSQESIAGAVSLETVRQSNTHIQWMKDHMPLASDAELFTVVVTPRKFIAEQAQQNAGELFYMHISDIKALANQTVSALAKVRGTATQGAGEDGLLIHQKIMGASGLSASSVVEYLKQRRLASLPIDKSDE